MFVISSGGQPGFAIGVRDGLEICRGNPFTIVPGDQGGAHFHGLANLGL